MQLAGMVYGLEPIHNFGQSLRERDSILTQWFGLFIQAAGFVGWLGGQLLKAAVSRQREYLADARRAVDAQQGRLGRRSAQGAHAA
jgi:Zn-dependent protease with chaperone function